MTFRWCVLVFFVVLKYQHYSFFIAAWLLESMDQTVNPCEDFYEFACGKWSKQNRMPESQTRWNTMNILSDRIVLIIKGFHSERNMQSLTVHNV